MIAFCHIPKTGGMTIEAILRRNFGIHHANVIPRHEKRDYSPIDLRIDRGINSGLVSIAGHSLKPFVDFAEFDDQLHWLTVLRDPVDRYVSHFEHQTTRKGYTADFREWMRRYRRSNFHVRMLAGEEDVLAAKQMLQEKFKCVGLQHEFNASLLMMRKFLALDNFDVFYPRRINAAQGDVKPRIFDEMELFRDEVLAQNALDVELIEFVTETIWPVQVQRFGERELETELRDAFQYRRVPFR